MTEVVESCGEGGNNHAENKKRKNKQTKTKQNCLTTGYRREKKKRGYLALNPLCLAFVNYADMSKLRPLTTGQRVSNFFA